MDYFSVVFALSLGFLFALMAYNKTGEVAPPVLGGFVCIVFWLLFNEVVGNVCGVFEFSPSWSNENLWTEACITSFVGAHHSHRGKTVRLKHHDKPAVIFS